MMNTFRIISAIIFQLGIFINAALFVPQAMKIFKNKSSHGLSLITFAGFNFLQLLAILHGIFHHDLAFAIGTGLSFITCGTVTIGIIIYKNNGIKEAIK